MEFGLFNQLPEGYTGVAWGARAIVEKNHAHRKWCETMRGREPRMYNVSLLHDRQSWKPEGTASRQELSQALNKGPIKKALEVAASLFANTWNGLMDEGTHVLYSDDKVEILGDPRASGGYLYIVAYWKEG
jgi:hypothetical protein